MQSDYVELNSRSQILNYEQVRRLDQVLTDTNYIHGRWNYPTLEVRLKDLIHAVRGRLAELDVEIRDIRLNGSAASYIVGSKENELGYNDLDLIFGVALSGEEDLKKIKMAVLESLLNFLPAGVNTSRISTVHLKDAYVKKMVKIGNYSAPSDRWSLISLTNNLGRNVELKFVDTMKRQFEFSVDSFQIILDSLLLYYDCCDLVMKPNFYPTVQGESVFGNFEEALYHLNNRLIATVKPEEIRGGGLLKYCNLLVHNYIPATKDLKLLQRYMCSRFFIDFPDLCQQQKKLQSYLSSHFIGNNNLKYKYLMTLRDVINESTVCLMGHERRCILELIDETARHTLNNGLHFQNYYYIDPCHEQYPPQYPSPYPSPPSTPNPYGHTPSYHHNANNNSYSYYSPPISPGCYTPQPEWVNGCCVYQQHDQMAVL